MRVTPGCPLIQHVGDLMVQFAESALSDTRAMVQRPFFQLISLGVHDFLVSYSCPPLAFRCWTGFNGVLLLNLHTKTRYCQETYI
jgi:hypothetical protein